MEWTIGTALQGSKYVIQEILRQSDVEVMYRAIHTYLDQPVLLRSLNPSCQQRDDFAQVKRQFVAEVRSQTKQATPDAAPVLDCFEEGNLPFVVLQFQPERFSSASPPPTAALSSPPHQPTEAMPVQDAATPDLISTFEGGEHATTNRAAIGSPCAAQSVPDRVSAQKDYEPIVFHPVSSTALTDASDGHSQDGHSQNGHSQNEHSQNEHRQNGHVQPDLKPARSLRQRLTGLPIALLTVSLVGGCIGVGTGLALRFDTTQSQVGSKPRLSLFNREQSFPSEGNWPIQESYAPEPTIEQPLYRATPAPDYTPSTTIQPLPSATAPIPELNPEATRPLPELNSPPDSAPSYSEPKLPLDSSPPQLGDAGEIPRPAERMQPVSPDNLLPPGHVAPAPLPPPAADTPIDSPPLKSLPDSSGI